MIINVSLVYFVLLSIQISSNIAAKKTDREYNFNPGNASIRVFVDPSGSDDSRCGEKAEPCKSVQIAVRRILDKEVASALIYVLPGIYESDSVMIDCSGITLKTLVIQGYGTNEGNLAVALSVNVLKCSIVFNGLHWKSSSSLSHVLLNLLITNASFVNSSATNLPFSMISLGSYVSLVNVRITNCSGWQPMIPILSSSFLTGFIATLSLQMGNFSSNHSPILLAKGLATLSITQCIFFSNLISSETKLLSIDSTKMVLIESHFIRNSGTVIALLQATIANISQTVFSDNTVFYGSLLEVGKHVVLQVEKCSFISTTGSSDGPVASIEKQAASVHLQSSYFSCNKVNNTVNMPPIASSVQHIVNCTNCTVDSHCPVYCPSGQYLMHGVMCVACTNGTYSPKGNNITTYRCRKCKPGYYNNKPGSDVCTPCKKGSFAAKPGSTMCSPCKSDFMTSDEGQASCSRMTIGCVVLVVCVLLLIIIPLALLAYQHLQNSTSKIGLRSKQANFKRLYDNPNMSMNVNS